MKNRKYKLYTYKIKLKPKILKIRRICLLTFKQFLYGKNKFK